jgi:hypothetical protein
MSAAAEIAGSLTSFADRGVGTDSERRAAVWLAEEIRRPGVRQAELHTFWCRPNWAMAQAWHAGLGLAGSLVSVASPQAGAAVLLVALLCVLADATFAVSPGRRLTPEHASQNVVSPATPRRAGELPRIRLILTANLDAGRQGLVYRAGLRRPCARLRRATGGRAPGWAAWLALALVWALVTALLRANGTHETAVKIAQLVPTVGLVIALALLLELAASMWSPAAGDNASGVAVAIVLSRALDALPPANLAVELVLSGAGDGQDLGLRKYLRAHRRSYRPADTVVLGIGPCGAGSPVWLRSDGSLIPLSYASALQRLCRQTALQDPELSLRELRARGTSPAQAARQSGLPAIVLAARDGEGLIPRSHQADDTAEALAPETMELTLRAGLELVDAIDAYLAERQSADVRRA